jgi:hypothetical protein
MRFSFRTSNDSLWWEASAMPLFEIETESHIIITWAGEEAGASNVVNDAYPEEKIVRMTRRPRDTWVISKSALGISGATDPCNTARDCLAKAAGDKVHAIRLYMHETGSDLERARKIIESNMVMGW